MKTSNIIILAVFVFIIVVSIWNMLEMKDNIQERIEVRKQNLVSESIGDFRTLVVSGEIKLNILPNKENILEYDKEDSLYFKIYYDTLFVKGTAQLNLKVNTLTTVILKDNVVASVKNWNEVRCKLQMSEQSVFRVESMHTQYLNLITLNNNVLKINDSRIDTLDLDVNNNSVIKIKDTKLKRAIGTVKNNVVLSIPYIEDWAVVKKDEALVSMD